jgi:hypothetical protein
MWTAEPKHLYSNLEYRTSAVVCLFDLNWSLKLLNIIFVFYNVKIIVNCEEEKWLGRLIRYLLTISIVGSEITCGTGWWNRVHGI